MYMLAESLHKCVYEIDEMSASEYFGWVAYFEETRRKQEASSGNLLAMAEGEMIEKLTNA